MRLAWIGLGWGLCRVIIGIGFGGDLVVFRQVFIVCR